MKSEGIEAISSIPEEIECPTCRGEGYIQEGEQNEQCEECKGEGKIVIAEYAEEHGQTLADAFQTIKSRSSGNPEE
jgi:DnaJ-class molecular chaperone